MLCQPAARQISMDITCFDRLFASVGLRRAGFTVEEKAEIKKFYKILYGSKLSLPSAIETMKAEVTTECGRQIIAFIEAESPRGILLK